MRLTILLICFALTACKVEPKTYPDSTPPQIVDQCKAQPELAWCHA